MTSTVIRLATGSGTLVIETDDPEIKVTIDGEEVQIQGAGVEQLTLKPGQYNIAATKNGKPVPISQELVRITRGGKQVVKVSLEGISTNVVQNPSGTQPSTLNPQPSDDPDRRAAEWVLSNGGELKITQNGNEREVKAIDELPEALFELTYVNMYLDPSPEGTDDGLACFRGCTNLSFLDIDGTRITDAGLAHFQDCRKLKYLHLSRIPATEIGLAYFRDCRDLEELHVTGFQVSDRGLALFRNCKGLKVLDLGQTTGWSEDGLRNFRECHNLEVLSLPQTRITDAGLAHFQACNQLNDLWLEGCFDWTDEGLRAFRNCKHLKVLGLTRSAITDAGLGNFENCAELARVELNLTRVTDAGLAHLKNCKKLKVVMLGSTQVTDTGVANLRDCQELEYLSLDDTQVTDATLVNLKGWPKLRMIGLGYTSVSDAALLEVASHPGLGCALAYTRVSLSGIEQLEAARPELKFDASSWSEVNRMVAEAVLSLGGKVEIGTPDEAESRPVENTAEFPDEFFQVRRVSFAEVEQPLNDVLPKLSELKYPKFDRLESIDLSGISGMSYEFLTPIAGLEELTLANNGLTDVTLAKLPVLPGLKRLVLDGNDIKEGELLATQQQLTELSLRKTKVTEAGAKKLAAAMPKCRIEWDGGVIEPMAAP